MGRGITPAAAALSTPPSRARLLGGQAWGRRPLEPPKRLRATGLTGAAARHVVAAQILREGHRHTNQPRQRRPRASPQGRREKGAGGWTAQRGWIRPTRALYGRRAIAGPVTCCRATAAGRAGAWTWVTEVPMGAGEGSQQERGQHLSHPRAAAVMIVLNAHREAAVAWRSGCMRGAGRRVLRSHGQHQQEGVRRPRQHGGVGAACPASGYSL